MSAANRPTYYVYIMASQKNGTIYIGVTNDIVLRSTNHRDGIGGLFTKRNNVQRLVYYEDYADVRDAIIREKHLKKWNRAWKIELIEKANPECETCGSSSTDNSIYGRHCHPRESGVPWSTLSARRAALVQTGSSGHGFPRSRE